MLAHCILPGHANPDAFGLMLAHSDAYRLGSDDHIAGTSPSFGLREDFAKLDAIAHVEHFEGSMRQVRCMGKVADARVGAHEEESFVVGHSHHATSDSLSHCGLKPSRRATVFHLRTLERMRSRKRKYHSALWPKVWRVLFLPARPTGH